jgi:hypothetical protein
MNRLPGLDRRRVSADTSSSTPTLGALETD